MKENLHNGYVKISPVPYESFLVTDKLSYNEIGIVLAKDETVKGIEIGSKVKFDSWLAKKYPLESKPGEFEWYVNYLNIISDVTE